MHGELRVAVHDPGDELRASAIDVGATGRIVVGGSRASAETLTRARAMGVAGIVLGGVLDKELRDFEATQQRRREVGGVRGDFAVLLLEGYGKVGFDPGLFAWFRAHDGHMASLFGERGAPVRLRRRAAARRAASCRAPATGSSPIAARTPGRAARWCACSTACTPPSRASSAARALVRFEDGRTAVVPLANLEATERLGELRPDGTERRFPILAAHGSTTAPATPPRARLSSGPDETREIGRRIGAAAGPGTVLALVGPLGAGKTQLAKGIAEGLGVTSVVNSPTFVLMNEHAGRLRLYHVDAYRLGDPEEALAAGLLDERQADGVTVVEWADRLDGWLPAERLEHPARDARRMSRCTARCAGTALGAAHDELAAEALEPGDHRHRRRLDRPLARARRARRHAARRRRLEQRAAAVGRAPAAPARAPRPDGPPLAEITALAVGTGPGSFTGLRVAMALAKGLAVGLRRPIVGVPSLRRLARRRSGGRRRRGPRRRARGIRARARGRRAAHRRPRRAGVAGRAARRAGRAGRGLRPRGRTTPARRRRHRAAAPPNAWHGDPPATTCATLEPIYLRAPRGVAAESEERVRWL